MINESLAKNWAEAIFEIYKEKKQIHTLENECFDLFKLLNNNEDYVAILSSLVLDLDHKKAIIKEAFYKKISTDLYNAINLMLEKGVCSLLLVVIKNIIWLIDDLNNTKHGFVYSVIKISNDQIKKIEEKISKKIKLKVKLVNRIDKSLIAGIKISVNNIVFDYSVLNQLNEIQENITVEY